MSKEIVDFRFQWFKDIIYKTLAIDSSDPAFEELLNADKFACELLNSFISGRDRSENCVFFYYTVEEEEVEVEDAYDQPEESEKIEISESSESEKLESENASIDDKTEGLDNNEDVDNAVLKRESPEDIASVGGGSKRLSRRSTSLLQIIKKNVLHACTNITTFLTPQRYAYFLHCKLEPIPEMDTLEEAFKIMPDYFQLGSINQHPLISMNKLLSEIYRPILGKSNWLPLMPPSESEMDDEKLSSAFNVFCKNIEEFLASTEETVLQIDRPIMFNAPSMITSCSVEELAQERSFVAEAEELASEWTEMISDLLTKSINKKPPENSLIEEINFWKRQKLTLSTCYDHLSKPSIQQSIEILKIANSDISAFQEKMEEVEKHLKTATENFSYLSLLEPLAKSLLPEKSLKDSQKAIEDILMLLKLIWIQSSYYKDVPNMCRLIKGIAMLLKEKVKKNADIENLFRKKLPEVKRIVTESAELLQFWKDQYLKQCENVKKYGGAFWWGFEIDVFFTETDHMILVCIDLQKVTKMLEELYNIFNTNLKYFVQDVKGLSVLEFRVFGITSRIQYANFDIFDPAFKTDWDKIMKTFLRDVTNFEYEIKLYISKMFNSILSWENAYILTKSFNKISISPSIRDFINKSRDDMLKQFIREIYEKENEFLSLKDDPPHYEDIPEIVSSIVWVHDLLLKLSRPTSQICDHTGMSKKELEVLERFQRTELLLKEYKHEKYEAWKVTATGMLNKFLQGKVLKKTSHEIHLETNDFQKILTYQVNFPIYLEEVSIEAKLLEYHGFEIPTFIKNVLLQEKLYYEHRHVIRIILENLKKSVSTVTEDEMSILSIPIENLCSVLDLGTNNIQWESSEVSSFTIKVKRAVAVFRSFISQIQNVFFEIDKRIESLADCDLFHFKMYNDNEVPTIEEFFGDAAVEMETKIEKIVDIHVSLQLLLKNLEKITSKTTTGEATQMKRYYRKCEEKCLMSLLKMTQLNLEYFKDEILKDYIFPYIELALESENELVTSSLCRAELIFVTFIENAVESSRRVIRWMDGTCLPSPTFHLEETKEQLEFSYYLDICMHPKVKILVFDILNNFYNFMNQARKSN